MSLSIKHKFVSAKVDGSDETVVQPSNWNDEHAITLGGGKLIGRSSEGDGDAEEISVGDGLALEIGDLQSTLVTAALVVEFHGGGTAISPDQQVDVICPFPFTIVGWQAVADQAGSIVIDVWKDAIENFPPDDTDSITASAQITISNDVKAEDQTLTGWETSVAAGDVLRFNVDSAEDIQRVTVVLAVRRP